MLISTTVSETHVQSASIECIMMFFLSFPLLGLLARVFIIFACKSLSKESCFNFRDGWSKRKGTGTWITGRNARFSHLSAQVGKAVSLGLVLSDNHDAAFEMK